MKVAIVNIENLPQCATPSSAGYDVKAKLQNIDIDKMYNTYIETDKTGNEKVVICPGGRALIPTGLYVAIPEGYEIQVRPRSGLALKKGITVLNTPGTIDADYRDEIGVILINHGDRPFEVRDGDRIAQLVLSKFYQIEWEKVVFLPESSRKGGFGSTGTN